MVVVMVMVVVVMIIIDRSYNSYNVEDVGVG